MKPNTLSMTLSIAVIAFGALMYYLGGCSANNHHNVECIINKNDTLKVYSSPSYLVIDEINRGSDKILRIEYFSDSTFIKVLEYEKSGKIIKYKAR